MVSDLVRCSNQFRKELYVILIISAAHFSSILIFDQLLVLPQFGGLISLLYLPAGINVIAMLVVGYRSVLGIGLGSFLWTAATKNYPFLNIVLISFIPSAVCAMTVCLYRLTIRKNSPGPWKRSSFYEIIFMILIYGIVNAGLHHIYFLVSITDGGFSEHSFLMMLFGDIGGALVMFVFLNVLTSVGLEILMRRCKAGG